MVKETSGKVCKFCGEDLAKDETHEEFDYFKHPLAKRDLLALQERYKSLPDNKQLYRMENWAVERKLRLGAKMETVDGVHIKPTGGSVVMPGYGRLVYADIWLRKLEGKEVTYLQERNAAVATDLPF